MLVFAGGEYIHFFFQVYFNLQRCPRFVSLEKRIPCVSKENLTRTPLGGEFHEVLAEKKKEKIALNTHLLFDLKA